MAWQISSNWAGLLEIRSKSTKLAMICGAFCTVEFTPFSLTSHIIRVCELVVDFIHTNTQISAVGGEKMLMSVAGKDATQLFEKYHRWVNYEHLLSKCHIGFVVAASSDASIKK